MPKIYAVKRGREVGYFKTWAECQANISGYPGAVYKSFARLVDARKFMMSEETLMQRPLTQQERDRIMKAID